MNLGGAFYLAPCLTQPPSQLPGLFASPLLSPILPHRSISPTLRPLIPTARRASMTRLTQSYASSAALSPLHCFLCVGFLRLLPSAPMTHISENPASCHPSWQAREATGKLTITRTRIELALFVPLLLLLSAPLVVLCGRSFQRTAVSEPIY